MPEARCDILHCLDVPEKNSPISKVGFGRKLIKQVETSILQRELANESEGMVKVLVKFGLIDLAGDAWLWAGFKQNSWIRGANEQGTRSKWNRTYHHREHRWL